MYKKLHNGIIATAISMSVLASGTIGAFAASFDDANDHWAKEAIEIWAGHEILQGDSGIFRPDDPITRGEMAVMINRIMNYQDTAENTFSDLPDTWYTDAILKLVKQGVMLGSDSEIRPEDTVTREEMLVMLARALKIKNSSAKTISFSDSAAISEWAKSAVQAMTDKGFINGYEDGSFRPQENMTRACSVTVLNNSIKGFYNKPGTYKADGEINGYVIVSSDNVILEGMQINGDLIITPGAKEGSVTLKDTTVSGEQIVISAPDSDEENSGESTDEDTEEAPESPKPSPSSAPSPTPGNGGSSSGGGGSSGGGSVVQNAASTDIIVNSSYEDKTGTVTVSNKRYTIGKNAFANLNDAILQAQSIGKKASITLKSDLTLDETIVIRANDLTLNGGKHTLTFSQNVKDGIQVETAQGVTVTNINIQMQDELNKWNGSYGIQLYESLVTLKDVTATGADGGILVNAAEVTLQGIIDVSGNEFGGIEVSKGALATSTPKLIGSVENLKNDTEENGKPTIWIDKVSELTTSVVEVTGLYEGDTEKDQAYYYINETNTKKVSKVSNSSELDAALADSDVGIIILTDNIESDKTIEITRPLTIRGLDDSKSIQFENKNGIQIVNADEVIFENIKINITEEQEGWQGIYAIQAYDNSKVTLKDVTATGADGGILVNAAEVTLQGIIDVSGNEFGGIEVSKGALATSTPKLIGSVENLKNDTEENGKPTIWIDKVSELTSSVVEVTGLYEGKTAKDQTHYYINEINTKKVSKVSNSSELDAALADSDVEIIILTDNIESDKTVEVTRPLTIRGLDDSKSIQFESKNGIQIVNTGEVILENVEINITGEHSGWQGIYAIQAYDNSKVTLKDVTATGADGGILVNAAEVTLQGIIDVSGNEFGGIEVSKGALATSTPKLIGSVENLKNDTEENGKPTIWIDKVSELTTSVVEVSGLYEGETEKDQTHYYIHEDNINE